MDSRREVAINAVLEVCSTQNEDKTWGERADVLVASLKEQGYALAAADAQGWRTDLENAPRDRTPILLLGENDEQEVGRWCAEGTSWNEDCSALMKTGVWDAGGGWLEPQEVRAWMPLPTPPGSEPADAQQDTVRVTAEYVEAAERLLTAAQNINCEPWPIATLYLHGSERQGRIVQQGHLRQLQDAERDFSEAVAAKAGEGEDQ